MQEVILNYETMIYQDQNRSGFKSLNHLEKNLSINTPAEVIFLCLNLGKN